MRVLIADDDPVYRTILKELLVGWDFEVTVATNGREALDAVRDDPAIRLAVLDWMMPEVNGFEVCRRLKQDDVREIYAILVTGSRNRKQIIRVLVAGADDYLLKPFESLDLKIRIRNAVRIMELENQILRLRGTTVQVPAHL